MKQYASTRSESAEPDLHKKVAEIAEVVGEVRFSNWEEAFLESMMEWKGDFTDKQTEVINRLYKRVCELPF